MVDILTKELTSVQHDYLCNKMGLVDSFSSNGWFQWSTEEEGVLQ